jgi:hypothetical protein
MATVTGYTAARMQEIEDSAIISGVIVGNNLILTRFDGTTVNAGNVRGPQGVSVSSTEILIPNVADGVTNNKTIIDDIIDAAPPQALLRFVNQGPTVTTALEPITKAIGIRGASGRWGTKIMPLTDDSSPIFDFDVGSSPIGGLYPDIWGLYGPSIEHLAIELSYAPSSIGVRVSDTTGWFEAHHLVVKGGTRSIENHGPNASFYRLILKDASDCMIFVDDTGLESSFDRINCARNVPGTTEAFMKVILVSSGQKGDLRLNGIQGQSSSDSALTENGIIITAPSLTNVPVFAKNVTLDNLIDAGLVLENIESVDWEGGWINSAGSPGGPCVRITGGGDITFRGVKYRGGGIPTKTYDFVGGSTRGFSSKDCYCPTGPVYFFPETEKPIDINVDDDVPGATILSQITNDVEGFRVATRRSWGSKKFMDRISQATTPWFGENVVIGEMLNGVCVLPAPDVDAFYSQFIPFRQTSIGVTGRLELAGRDPVEDEVTIHSYNSSGAIETGDDSIIGYFRIDIPH